jgi:hypothetical protein
MTGLIDTSNLEKIHWRETERFTARNQDSKEREICDVKFARGPHAQNLSLSGEDFLADANRLLDASEVGATERIVFGKVPSRFQPAR